MTETDPLPAGAAERAHAAHDLAVATTVLPLVAMGTEMLKAVCLINGGAAVATLLFVSQSLRDDRGLALALVAPLATFGFGLTVAAFATGWSYFAQAEQGRALGLRQKSASEPFVIETEPSREASRRSDRFRLLALAAVMVSCASAVGGFGLAGAILLIRLG